MAVQEKKLSSIIETKIPLPSQNYETKFLTIGADNITDQYVCQTNDNLDQGNWATISDVYNTFTMFPALTTNASIYFGNPTNTMAFQINILTTPVQSSNLVLEIWNGSVWMTVTTMSM